MSKNRNTEIQNNEYSLTLRKFAVKTDLGTLLKLRMILRGLGLEGLLKSGSLESSSLAEGLMNAVGDPQQLFEFCNIVTGKENHDWQSEQFGTVCWVVQDFFDNLYWQMPASWRARINATFQDLVKLGRAMLPSGGTTQPTG